ncbi:MAG: hypothetical protein WCW40_05105, partial [Bacteroidota bacterium]
LGQSTGFLLRSRINMKNIILSLAVVLLLVLGCEKAYDISSLPPVIDVTSSGDTTYIQKGEWRGFSNPQAILYGTDQLFYVADTYNDRIVLLDQAGSIRGILNGIRRPRCLAQDNRLDLLIGAEHIEPNTLDTIGIVYRVKLVNAHHQIGLAKIDTVWKEPARPKRRFVGIAVTVNDEFLVVRDGPDNTSPVDPDSRVLRFGYVKTDSVTYKDKMITPLGDFQAGQGIAITTLNHPTGIASFPSSKDFVLVQNSDGIQYSAVWMAYTISSDFEGWIAKYDPVQVTGIDFIRPNRFKDARAVAIDRVRKDIFIVDAELDSVVKFNSRGRFKSESFGAKSVGISLNHPSGIAVAENTLYVCDSGNNRIVLYRLSTDR